MDATWNQNVAVVNWNSKPLDGLKPSSSDIARNLEPVATKMQKKNVLWIVWIPLLVATFGGSGSQAMSLEEKHKLRYSKYVKIKRKS